MPSTMAAALFMTAAPEIGAEVVREEVRVGAHAAVLGTVAAALLVFGAAGRELHEAGSSRGNAAEGLDDELDYLVVLVLWPCESNL